MEGFSEIFYLFVRRGGVPSWAAAFIATVQAYSLLIVSSLEKKFIVPGRK
jgi:hypothetical protein